MMEQLNFSINFFLYVVCSKGFRRNLLQVGELLSMEFEKQEIGVIF